MFLSDIGYFRNGVILPNPRRVFRCVERFNPTLSFDSHLERTSSCLGVPFCWAGPPKLPAENNQKKITNSAIVQPPSHHTTRLNLLNPTKAVSCIHQRNPPWAMIPKKWMQHWKSAVAQSSFSERCPSWRTNLAKRFPLRCLDAQTLQGSLPRSHVARTLLSHWFPLQDLFHA